MSRRRYEYLNPRVEILFGYAPSELIGQPIEILLPDYLREKHKKIRANYLENPRTRPMGLGLDLLARKKNGELFPVDISLGTSRAQNGSIQVAAVIRDMSERKLLENRQTILARLGEALSDHLGLDARLQSAAIILSESLCDWVTIDLISDHGGVRRVAVANSNPAQAEILTRLKNDSPSHLQTDGVLRCIRDQKPALVSSLDWSEIDLKYQTEPEDLKLYKELGILSYMRFPLTARGTPRGVITLKSQNSNFNEVDLQFGKVVVDRIALALDNARLYEEAVEAVRIREDILAIVAHDLRNPLTALKLSQQLLLRKVNLSELNLSDLDLSGIQRLLKSMEYSVNQAISLTSDLLDFGKMGAGRFSVELLSEDPQSLIQEVISSFKTKADAIGAVLDTEAFYSFSPILADRKRVIQVFSNLIGNSLKFAGGGGTISVGSRDSSADETLFSVRDRGPGIPEDVLPFLFDRYWQPDRTRQQGTGLGLFIAKGIVESHGGKIWVESKLGEGTTFSFTLKRALLPLEVSHFV
jgi:PAS domain S-box-containing protein